MKRKRPLLGIVLLSIALIAPVGRSQHERPDRERIQPEPIERTCGIPLRNHACPKQF
jgi:nitrous oxide reductase accessory protein NosL